MKNYIFLFISILSILDLKGQDTTRITQIDCFYYNSIFYRSRNIENAKRKGIYFKEFNMLDCGSGESMDGINRISNIINYDSILIFKVSIENNCCINYFTEIDIVEDSIINLIYHELGDLCLCDCNFCMDYVIEFDGEQISNYAQLCKRRKWNIPKYRYAMINGDKSTTINFTKYLKREF